MFIKGMDISTLLEEENCGARYYDNGVEQDLFAILKAYGTNSVRLRLWNDPYAPDGTPYGAGTNDLNKVIVLAGRAKKYQIGYLLDLHYSDFWADPGKQTTPKAWQGMNEDELEAAVYRYTKEVMQTLKDKDLLPEMVQVGNELTNGLLWPSGRKPEFDRIAKYLNAGIRAVREIQADIPIMIHLDNGGFNEMYVEWFDEFTKRAEPFDIIGLSYYPFWHGTMEDYRDREGKPLDQLKEMATKPELVEKLDYPMTKEGQTSFMKDLMELIADIPGGEGFYYWEPAWIPVPGCGWATEAALAYIGEKGPGGNEWANQALFDYDGNALPALAVIRDFNRLNCK
jgi:arabinogalactan endo-1,4-beta-galactosidase